ncbi:MAG TPA: squalene synthase HpnC [Streptosporangiaceae bacterium]
MTRDATRSEDASAPGGAARPGGAGASTESARVITAGAGAKAADENFPVALRLLPGRYRQHLTAVYGFARSADDMGDEAPPGERLALLDELEADLGRLYEPGGEGPRLPVIQALAPSVAQCAIPAQPFLDLIQANRQDQVVTRYQTFDELLAYCRLSANPVGRIVLCVFGVATPTRERLSDLVCTALQLAEHWQDVAEDLGAGRVYLPGEDLAGHGVSEADLAAPSASPQVRALITVEVRRAAGLLDEGARIVGTLHGFARAAVAGYVAGGRAALAAITASGYDVLAATPRPRKHRVAAELLRAYLTGR